MKKIYIFRHAQTDFNKNRIIAGQQDVPLNEEGIEEVKKLANKMSKIDLDIIISSPLKRALQTANFVAEKQNKKINIKIIEDLKECNCGDFEGQKVDNVLKNPKTKNIRLDFVNPDPKFLDCRQPNGESKRELRTRVINALRKFLNQTEHNIIGVSTHYFPMKQIYQALNKERDAEKVYNCEVFLLEYNENNQKNPLKFLKRSSKNL